MGPGLWHNWNYRTLFVLLAFVIIAIRLMPLVPSNTLLVPPDLLLAITIAWVLRQPAVVPMGLIVLVFLLADFLLQRPPGLWTALVLIITESLRAQRNSMAELNFALEWAWVTGLILAITIADRVVLWVLGAQQTTLGLALLHALSTIIVYPLVVAVSRYIFGLRNLSPSESDPT